MNLAQRLMILGTLAAAGCSSYPDYEAPKKRDKPVIEDKVEVAVKIETPVKVDPPKDTTTPKLPEDAPKPAYQAVAFEVVYNVQTKQVAAMVRGFAKMTGKSELETSVGLDTDKDGKITSVETDNGLKAYSASTGIVTINLPYVKDGSDIKYAVTLDIPSAEAEAIKSRFTGNAYNRAETVKVLENVYKKHVDK